MELSITEDAAEEFKKSVKGIEPSPYLRIGAKKEDVRDGHLLLRLMKI